jgi:hypothetical protein
LNPANTTQAGVIDTDAGRTVGWPPPDEGSDVTRSRPEVAAGHDLSVVVCGDRGHSDRVWVDSHADVQRARLWPG